MTEFSRGFWIWATDHWFLGFILACAALWGATSVLSGFFRIFRRPSTKLTIQMQGGRTEQRTVPTNDDINSLLASVARQSTKTPPTRQAPLRRTVWDRIRANADEDD